MQLTALSLALTRIGLGGFGVGSALNLDFTSGNQSLDPRITFTRASNATVTGPDGVLGYAPHNLLTHSEQFDAAAWSKNALTIEANAAIAPDGTKTADKVVATGVTTSDHALSQGVSVAGSIYSPSVYAKAGGYDFLLIRGFGLGGSGGAIFNLQTGAVESVSGFTAAAIEDAGNGWYRCSATGQAVSANGFFVNVADAPAWEPFTGDGVSGLFLWGAQLNVGPLQPYYPTTVKNLLGYTQEFDNAAWTKSNAFVQTNLLTFSEQFDSASWGKLNASVTANSTIAPNGTLTADKLVENTTTSGHSVNQGVSGAFSLSTITVSIYVKAAERTAVSFWIRGAVLSNRFQFAVDLTNGSISGQQNLGNFTDGAATAEAVGNDWYRISARVTTGGSESIVTLLSYIFGGGTVSDPTYTGDGTSGLFIWGAQLVQGSTPGDYQRTEAAAKAVMYPAPDGSLTADKLVESAVSSTHLISPASSTVVTGTPYVFSCYAKAGERNGIRLTAFNDATDNEFGSFDLIAGTATFSGGATPLITPVGDGWYRCAVVFSNSVDTGTGLSMSLLNNGVASYTGDGTSGIYIWGAQLSDSASLDPYVYNPEAAPTAQAYYGPRFDYDPVTLAPKGLLIEEQRTNLTPYSRYETGAWSLQATSVGTETKAGIDGTTVTAFLTDTSTTAHRVIRSVTSAYAANSVYSFSVYVAKPAASDIRGVIIRLRTTTGGQAVVLFVSNDGAESTYEFFSSSPFGTNPPPAVAAADFSATPVGNGWVRLSIKTAAATVDTNFTQWDIGFSSANNSDTGAGTANSQLFIDGAQLEAGAFPTSYIPTTTAAATRAADVAVMTGANFSNWYRQDEGTLFADFIRGPDGIVAGGGAATPRVLNVDDGTNSLQVRFNSSATIEAASNIGIYIARNWSANVSNKAAVAYKADDSSLGVNSSVASDLSGSTGSTMTNIKLGANTAGTGGFLNGHIRRIGFFPRRLTNSELQGITS